jgi:hypothetical protein
VALTILYRHRDRPDEAGMIMISAHEEVGVRVDQLEKRGFVVDKITARLPLLSPRPQAAPAPAGQAVRLRNAQRPIGMFRGDIMP